MVSSLQEGESWKKFCEKGGGVGKTGRSWRCDLYGFHLADVPGILKGFSYYRLSENAVVTLGKCHPR
jgi:hypothetical protein